MQRGKACTIRGEKARNPRRRGGGWEAAVTHQILRFEAGLFRVEDRVGAASLATRVADIARAAVRTVGSDVAPLHIRLCRGGRLRTARWV